MKELLSLRHRTRVPPGHGFPYKDEQTGFKFVGSSMSDLCRQVYEHRTSNHLIPLSEATIEDNVCRRLIEAGHADWCKNSGAPWLPLVPNVKMGLREIIQGSLAIGESLIKGNPKVDREEAERRAAICVVCAFNVQPEDCGPCNSGKMREIIRAIVGSSKTSRDAELKSCAACGCFNAVQVFFPLDILHRYMGSELNARLPDHCWKKVKP
jgi:hypothetical protein